MPRDISYLFTQRVNESLSGSHEYAFKYNMQHHYKKFYRNNTIITSTGISAGFLVTILSILQAALAIMLKENDRCRADAAFNAVNILIPVISGFIIALANSSTKKANREMSALIQVGIRSQFFCRSPAIPHQHKEEVYEDNENALKFQLGMSDSS